jgi:hypothetical protein
MGGAVPRSLTAARGGESVELITQGNARSLFTGTNPFRDVGSFGVVCFCSAIRRAFMHCLPFVCVVAGCRSISVDHRSVVEYHDEVPCSVRYALVVDHLSSSSRGPDELVAMSASTAHREVQVRAVERTWDEVHRERFIALAGVHADYSLRYDLILEPVLGAAALLSSPVILLASLLPLSEPGDPPTIFQKSGGGLGVLAGFTLGMLPFVSYDGYGREETIRDDFQSIELEPATHSSAVMPDSIKGQRVDWSLRLSDGREVSAGNVCWPGPIVLPWCELVLQNPKAREFHIALTSSAMSVSGALSARLPVDLVSAVRRQWPDAASAPPMNARIQSVALVDGEGRHCAALRAGTSALVRIVADNTASGSPNAYAVTPVVMTTSDMIRVHSANTCESLAPGATTHLEIELSSPLYAPDADVPVRFALKDVFGRTSAPFDSQLRIVQADLPALQVFLVTAREPLRANSSNVLDVVIRNRGRAPASDVTVSLRDLPAGWSSRSEARHAGELAAGERWTTAMPIRVGETSGEVSITVMVSESLGVETVPRKVAIHVLAPPSMSRQ